MQTNEKAVLWKTSTT